MGDATASTPRVGLRERVSHAPEPIAGAEFLPHEAMQRLQQERLGPRLAYVASAPSLFQELWAAHRLPDRLESLAELPLCDKEMLREDQAGHPPFGRYLAVDPALVCRVHCTGGTTGHAMNLALSWADAALTECVGARPGRAAGLGLGHRVVHCLNYQLWTGGYTDHAILERTGGGRRAVRRRLDRAVGRDDPRPPGYRDLMHAVLPGRHRAGDRGALRLPAARPWPRAGALRR
ncbi:MAG: hypothetical protein OXG37_06925 [Actinomycetia bacterium]|nr:hypothetical protein [Actinomycetes bacterium]